jgi:ribosome biogenesis GTPase / thiamine phosphate phosphatase
MCYCFPRRNDSLPKGVVVKGVGGFYYIMSGDNIYECRARGIFRKNGISPLPGDRVVFEIIDSYKKTGILNEIMERKTVLERPVVANANQLIIVISVHLPEPDFLLVDKLLIEAQRQKMNACICINKIDLDSENLHEEIKKIYANTGFKIINTSFKTNIGFENLKKILEGRISVFAGQSGVGKSTILNTIMNSWIMETGEISKKVKRGKHTTKHAELLIFGREGFVVDTPGFSSYSLKGLSCNELQFYYPEFEEYIKKCRFTGCSHINEPGCGVKGALENFKIDMKRYDRYVRLFNEMKNINRQKERKDRK